MRNEAPRSEKTWLWLRTEGTHAQNGCFVYGAQIRFPGKRKQKLTPIMVEVTIVPISA